MLGEKRRPDFAEFQGYFGDQNPQQPFIFDLHDASMNPYQKIAHQEDHEDEDSDSQIEE
jgi:hypothetical protein